MLKKTGRVLALFLAILVIILSLGGIVGAWWANSTASNITVQAFAAVDTAVNVVDAGVGRVNSLVQTGRSEVQQTAVQIVTVADELRANRPVLTALSERLETRLGPTVDQIRETLAPVREALLVVANVVSLANRIPGVSERAPRLDAIDQVFDRLSALSADIRQLRTTVREAAVAEVDRMTQQAVDVLTGVTTRIDNRLAETEANIQQVQAEIQALRDRLDAQRSRLLLIYNLTALGLTLFLLWVIYSQVVVMRYHWHLLRSPVTSAAVPAVAAPVTSDGTTVSSSPSASTTSVTPAVVATPALTGDVETTEVAPEPLPETAIAPEPVEPAESQVEPAESSVEPAESPVEPAESPAETEKPTVIE